MSNESPKTVNRTAKAKRSRWSTRELVTLAVFAALGMVLSFIKIPIFPAAPYLLYDPSGVVVQIVSWLPTLIMEPLGTLLTFVAMVGMVLVAGLIYKKWHTFKGAVAGLVISAVPFIVLAILMNFVITPLYSGASIADVAALVLPVLVPFNVLKCALNIVLTLLVYKSVSNLVKNRDSRAHE